MKNFELFFNELNTDKKIFISSNQIEKLKFDLLPYSFKLDIKFWGSNNNNSDQYNYLQTLCINKNPIESSLIIKLNNETILFNGIVVTKKIIKNFLSGDKILWGNFNFIVEDKLKALYSRHYFLECYINTSLQEIILANINNNIKINITAKVFSDKQEILCLPLQQHLQKYSFYDYVLYLAKYHQVKLIYNYKNNEYYILGLDDNNYNNFDKIGNIENALQKQLELSYDFGIGDWQERYLLNSYAASNDINNNNKNNNNKNNNNKFALLDFKLEYYDNANAGELKKKYTDNEASINQDAQDFSVLSSENINIISFVPNRDIKSELINTGKVFKAEIILQNNSNNHSNLEYTNTENNIIFDTSCGKIKIMHAEHIDYYNIISYPKYPVIVEGYIINPNINSEKNNTSYYIEPSEENNNKNHFTVSIPVFNKTIKLLIKDLNIPGYIFLPPGNGQKVKLGLYQNSAKILSFLDYNQNLAIDIKKQEHKIYFGAESDNTVGIYSKYNDNNKLEFNIDYTDKASTSGLNINNNGIEITLVSNNDGN